MNRQQRRAEFRQAQKESNLHLDKEEARRLLTATSGGVILPAGAPVPAPPVLLEVQVDEEGTKQRMLFPQVLIAGMGDQILAQIAAVTANLTVKMVHAMLVQQGVLVERPLEEVESKQDTPSEETKSHG